MSMKKDMFLYLNMNDRFLGLNLRDFCERSSSKSKFEVVQDLNYPKGRRPRTNSNITEQHWMTVCNSNLFMMRGNEIDGVVDRLGRPVLNLDVYSCDPTGPDDCPSIRLCDDSAAPKLMDSNPIVVTLEEKIYVLDKPPYRRRSDDDEETEPQLFWVFDPFYESWKQLPNPPLYNEKSRSVCDNGQYEVAYGHKLFISTWSNQCYVFDAHQEKWGDAGTKIRCHYDDHNLNFNAIVELDEGFLIAVHNSRYQHRSLELVAYKLDANGIPKQHQVLHELKGMFPCRPLLCDPNIFLGKCDDGLMWLVYSGKDNVKDFSCTGVVVFRVSMSYDVAGNSVFSTDIEAAEFFDSVQCDHDAGLSAKEIRKRKKRANKARQKLNHEDAKEPRCGATKHASSDSVVYSASAMCHDNLKTEKNDWFLYLNMGDRLCRLNISEFCERKSSFMSKFGVVHDFHPQGRPSTIPSRMRHIIVASKVYLVGGERLDRRIHSDTHGRCFAMPNLDIYALSHTQETEEGPFITLCQCEGSIPRLIDPRTKTIPITFTLEDKIYVLAKRPYLGDAEELNDHDQPPLFKVFDPLNQSWKHLPHPPCYDITSRDIEPYVRNHFSWGHKFIIRTDAKRKKNPGTYIFDTHQGKWEDAKNISAILDEGFRVVAEFQGFLIGMPYKRQELVAYHLDSNGIPKLSKVLHELQGIFCSCLLVSDCFLGKFDDDRMWLVYSGQDSMKFWHTRVAVFRVFISNDLDGNQVLCADLEAAEFFDFDRIISSAFTFV